MAGDEQHRTDDIPESEGPNTSEEDLREEARLEDAEAGEHWEMTGEGAELEPDGVGAKTRMTGSGAVPTDKMPDEDRRTDR